MRLALAAAVWVACFGVVRAEEDMPEKISRHCAVIDQGLQLARWKRAIATDQELANSLRSIEESQAFVDKWAPVLADHEKQARYAERQLKKQRGKNGRDKWKAEFDRENGSALKLQKAILEVKQRLKSDQEKVEQLKLAVTEGAKENKQNEASPPYQAEEFRLDRKDGSFRQGEEYFRIGEIFFYNGDFSKEQAERFRGSEFSRDNLQVIQVLDRQSALVSHRHRTREAPPVFLMRGIDTSEIREQNLDTWFQSGTFIVSGTHRYETITGRINTVFVLEPFDVEEVKKWWPVYQAEKNAKK